MRTIGSYEAKTHLPRLLDDVAHGEVITITKNGKPVARLVPAEEQPRHSDVQQVIDEWLRYRNEHNLRVPDGMTIRDMIEDGRRY